MPTIRSDGATGAGFGFGITGAGVGATSAGAGVAAAGVGTTAPGVGVGGGETIGETDGVCPDAERETRNASAHAGSRHHRSHFPPFLLRCCKRNPYLSRERDYSPRWKTRAGRPGASGPRPVIGLRPLRSGLQSDRLGLTRLHRQPIGSAVAFERPDPRGSALHRETARRWTV